MPVCAAPGMHLVPDKMQVVTGLLNVKKIYG